jgi:hypothetical protein
LPSSHASNPSLNRVQLPILDIDYNSPPTPKKRNNQDLISQNNITLSSTSLSNRILADDRKIPPYRNINDITTSAHEFLNSKNNGSNSNLNTAKSKFNPKTDFSESNFEARRNDAASPDANLSKTTKQGQITANNSSNIGSVIGGIKVLPTSPLKKLNVNVLLLNI